MKKIFAIVLALVLCLSLCSCGSKEVTPTEGGDTIEATTDVVETTENAKKNSIDFTTDKGTIKYVGFEKANAGLVDEENVLVFKFSFTNLQEIPAQSQSAFTVQFFQNGVEIKDSLSWSSKGGDQYDLVSNYFTDVMKDGTVTYGRLVKVSGDSPVTVMVKERSGENYQMMEVDIAGGGNTENSETADTTAASAEPATTEAVTEAAVKKIWYADYYVDDFDQPTDEWYIANNNYFTGKFSNSATTDSLLNVQVLVDHKKDIVFFLYEYGRNTVKNSSQSYVDKYDIVMRTPDGTDHNLKGTLYCGGDRIFIDEAYVDTVLKALQGEGDIMFRFVKSDRTVETYLFKVTAGNFVDLYSEKTK